MPSEPDRSCQCQATYCTCSPCPNQMADESLLCTECQVFVTPGVIAKDEEGRIVERTESNIEPHCHSDKSWVAPEYDREVLGDRLIETLKRYADHYLRHELAEAEGHHWYKSFDGYPGIEPPETGVG